MSQLKTVTGLYTWQKPKNGGAIRPKDVGHVEKTITVTAAGGSYGVPAHHGNDDGDGAWWGPQSSGGPHSWDFRRKKEVTMTNQNVVVADEQQATMKMAAPGGCEGGSRSISTNMKKVDMINGGAKINSWVDSMRASSPTRTSSMSGSLTEEEKSWALQYPSALAMFDKIVEASKGKKIVMFLDYDGTLSPIVKNPDRAFMSDAMRSTVKSLAQCFPTAIVSGRCRDKVYNFVQLAELYYAGSHGMDIKGPEKGSKYIKGDAKGILFQPAAKYLPMMDEVYKTLVYKTKSTRGAMVEHNKFCLSVHYRCVDEKNWDLVAQQVKSVLKEYPKLKLTQGRKVLEIRPTIKWDKGKALEFLLKALGYANCRDVFPVYIGDDRTDEDAFKILKARGQGFGILVSKCPKDTSASYSLQEPTEVMTFLQKLVDWKLQSVRGQAML
ncbi:hypothetical protein TIFTF001_004304 [Ficus carica]|uniref:Trehalose 6-phosphate phosphatase n=1 Tax=Ficus carica TaxID=3494 RepID=A0AA88A441_FICCA|nr:hypothetical protein TIFTF001_004304 [Ficus carica]